MMRITKWLGIPAVALAAVLTIGCGPDTSTEVLEGPVDEQAMDEYESDQAEIDYEE